MGTQNVMLDLTDEMIAEAERRAVREQKTVPDLLRSYIGEALEKNSSYDEAHREFLSMLDEGMNLGTNGNITWTRDELHERNF